MTSTSAAPDTGGTSSVLLIWSALIIVIGAILFVYMIVVTLRGRRRRRRRRPGQALAPAAQYGPGGQQLRPQPPPPASRPLALPAALPAGPSAGGMPVARHFGSGGSDPRALPAGPSAGPGRGRALPPGRYPSPPPPVALPSAGSAFGPSAGSPPGMPQASPPALPAGPVVGSGYAGGGYGYQPPQQPTGPTVYGAPVSSPSGATTGVPAISSAPAAYSEASSVYGAPPSAYTEATELHPNVVRHDARAENRTPRQRRGKNDECATLRAECEQLREIAANTQAAAVQAALDAEATHADFLAAQRVAEETRRTHDAAVRESAGVAAEIAALERAGSTTATPGSERERLQAETSHAAFAAYRRGDISSEQLREVFKRAEGWTPEHDRLAKRSTELRAEETETGRAHDAAMAAADDAGERARAAAIAARTLDDQARTAAVDARGRCAAADACEQRGRR